MNKKAMAISVAASVILVSLVIMGVYLSSPNQIGGLLGSSAVKVNRSGLARYNYMGTTYFFYYTTYDTIVVEVGGKYQHFPATTGNAFTVNALRVVVSEVYPSYVILLVNPL